MLFYRFISENITNYINEGEQKAGDKDFDFAKLSDAEAESARRDLVQEKGFFILPSELFANVRTKAKDNENLNETLEAVFRHIEESARGTESEKDFSGLFDDLDVNSNKLGNSVAERNKRFEDAKSEVERIEACCTEEEFTTVEEENMPKNDELCQVVYS